MRASWVARKTLEMLYCACKKKNILKKIIFFFGTYQERKTFGDVILRLHFADAQIGHERKPNNTS
jgi:hypothetical protein